MASTSHTRPDGGHFGKWTPSHFGERNSPAGQDGAADAALHCGGYATYPTLPVINASTAPYEHILLSFYIQGTNLSANSDFGIDVSPNGGSTWITHVCSIAIGPGDNFPAWTYRTCDLTDYPSSNLRLRFDLTSMGPGICLDTITVAGN